MDMCTMSKAAIAPRQPFVSEKDRQHKLFPEYSRYRSSMSILLVQASSFRDWLYARETEERMNEVAKHPRMKDFQQWMIDNKGGGRRCPAGCFPANFIYWLEGNRW